MAVKIISNPHVKIAPMCRCCLAREGAGWYMKHHEDALHRCVLCDEECAIIPCWGR